MRKYVPIPISAIMDPELTDAEKNLLFKMIANFGTAIIKPNEPFLTTLKISRRTFYRLIDNLLKHQYIQRSEDGLGFKIAVTMLAQNSARYDTDSAKVGTEECQSWHTENEEERTKEEDKEYIYNTVLSDFNSLKVQENEKEKEIPKKEKSGSEELPERFSKEYREIIDYLNEKTGKKFSARSRVNQGHMSARLKEGFTVEDFKRVIDIKCFQWKDDSKMSKFLRPETLFGTKFDRYLNEEKAVTRVTENGWEYVKTEEANFLDELLGGSNG